MDYYIGLDLGTTGIKALIFDADGIIAGEQNIEAELLFPELDFIEQDPALWYETAAEAIRMAIATARIDPKKVRAIGVSSQGISIVPVNSELQPLGNALSWLDMRAKSELNDILTRIDSNKIYQMTGKSASESYSLPKMLWIKKNLPQVFKETRYFLMPMDYAIAKFTGVVMTDHTMASGTMAYDIATQCWSSEILNMVGIRREKLPDIRWAGEVAGHLTEKAAKLCGLTCDTIVVNGGQDQKVAAYGAGLDDGIATISIGTAGAVEFLYNQPTFHSQKIPAFSYLKENKWVLEGCIGTAGAAIKWMRNILFPEMTYDEIDKIAAQAPVGSNGVRFLPFLSGYGNLLSTLNTCGSYEGLKLSTTRSDMARALIESLAYESRIYIDAAEQQSANIRLIKIFGGGSKSAFLCQTFADVTGRVIHSFACPEMGAFGAARLASQGCGIDIAQNNQDECLKWLPIRKNQNQYDIIYDSYCRNLSNN